MLHELIISPRTRWRKMHRRKQMAAIFVVQPKRRFMGGPIKRSINSLSRWSDMAKMHNYSPLFRFYIPLIRLLWDITDVTTESPAWPVLLNEPHGSGENSRSSLAPATVEGCWGKPSRKWCRPEIFNPTMTRQWENDGWQGTNKIHHHHGHYHLAESNVKYADVHTCVQCRDSESRCKEKHKSCNQRGRIIKREPFSRCSSMHWPVQRPSNYRSPGNGRQVSGPFSFFLPQRNNEKTFPSDNSFQLCRKTKIMNIFFLKKKKKMFAVSKNIRISRSGSRWCTTNVETVVDYRYC